MAASGCGCVLVPYSCWCELNECVNCKKKMNFITKAQLWRGHFIYLVPNEQWICVRRIGTVWGLVMGITLHSIVVHT